MRWGRGIGALCALVAACADPGARDGASVRLRVAAAPAVSQPQAQNEVSVITLSPAALGKIAELRAVIARNSLNRLIRQARDEPTFISNFAGESHRVHWDLLRRTGFDPLRQLELLLSGPYGTRKVGDEVWYIWPDLAARMPEDLQPERLSFSERARLRDLIGEAGLQRIRDGQRYPGVRTAISETGRWLYFVHESEDEITEDRQ